MSPAKEVRDVGSIRLTEETTPARFAQFCGAIEAARRLGHSVTLRVFYTQDADGVRSPLDVYAEVEL